MQAILDYLFPSNCLVCGAWPKLLCTECAPLPQSIEFELAGLTCRAAGVFEGDLAEILRALKDRNLVSLARPLAALLDSAISELPSADNLLLPPRNRSNYRRRGFHPIELIVSRSSRLLGVKRLTARPARNVVEQRRLGRAEREQNLAESLEVPSGSGRILVCDDVVTSGATMREMIRAAQSAGYEVVGGCAIAVSSGFSVLPRDEKGVVCR